eukprot:4758232-Pleurochrysis_carterae.AAC.1
MSRASCCETGTIIDEGMDLVSAWAEVEGKGRKKRPIGRARGSFDGNTRGSKAGRKAAVRVLTINIVWRQRAIAAEA